MCKLFWMYYFELICILTGVTHSVKRPNITKKTKLAYWIVSHCKTQNRREDYVTGKNILEWLGCMPQWSERRGQAVKDKIGETYSNFFRQLF